MSHRPRSFPLGLALIALAALAGVGSRRYAGHLPGFLAAYAGDAAWAFAAFFGVGLLSRRASTGTVALLALVVSLAVECLQLYHAPWIDSIRRTTVGGLALGHEFVWTDLTCYAVGVGLGALVERAAWLSVAPGDPADSRGQDHAPD